MLEYVTHSGALALNGKVIGAGYSGHEWGKNNPAACDVPGIGPIPPGKWGLVAVRDSANTGPYTIILEPRPDTDTKGRSAFRIHGDNIKHPGTASHGCIILPRSVRERIWKSDERILTVT